MAFTDVSPSNKQNKTYKHTDHTQMSIASTTVQESTVRQGVPIPQYIQDQVLSLRREAYNLRDIGKKVGISASTAGRIIKANEYMSPKPYSGPNDNHKRKRGLRGTRVPNHIRHRIFRLSTEGLTQREIGRKTGLSHTTVARFLKVIKERGLQELMHSY